MKQFTEYEEIVVIYLRLKHFCLILNCITYWRTYPAGMLSLEL